MTLGLKFGIDQLAIYAHLEPASIRRSESDRFDQVLELFKELIRQAHGPVSIVSDGAVNNLDLQHPASRWGKSVRKL